LKEAAVPLAFPRVICPLCRRPVQTSRLGVFWPAVKALILDKIAAGGELGVTTEDILNTIYDGRRRPQASCVKSHVHQINDILETDASGWRIVRDGGVWILRRQQQETNHD
jgi:hypothetical protein